MNQKSNIAKFSGKGLICCGDDKGTLWIYNLPQYGRDGSPALKATVEPSKQLPWPELQDDHLVSSCNTRYWCPEQACCYLNFTTRCLVVKNLQLTNISPARYQVIFLSLDSEANGIFCSFKSNSLWTQILPATFDMLYEGRRVYEHL